MITAASLFSGIGGAELALPEARWLWCAEIEPFPSAVLAHRFGHPNLGDITAPDFIDRARSFGRLDLLCGGPPCQAFSVAGLRKGMDDPRGQLSLRFIEIAHALADHAGLRNALVENVPGWLSHEDNAFGCFLGGLVGADDALLPCERPAVGKSNPFWRWRSARRAWMLREPGDGGLAVYIDDPAEYDPAEIQMVELDARHVPSWPRAGMVAGPRARAAWRVLDAQYAGLAQRRERVLLVADFGDGADPAAVLFERQGLHGNSPPRREAGEGTAHDLAPCLTSGGRGVERTGETRGQDPVIAVPIGFGGNRQTGPIDVATAVNAHGGPQGRQDFETETFIVAPTLDASFGRLQGCSGQDANHGHGHLVPVAFSCKDFGADATDDLSPTLRAMGHADSHANAGGQMAVAFDLRGREGGAQFEGPHDTANIHAASGGSSRSYVAEQWAVRRLTPTECERLQGYPDGWTLIEHGSRRTVEPDEADYLTAQGAHVIAGNDGKLRTNAAADGPRYKALGNAWAVACVRPVAKGLFDRLTAGGVA